MNSRRLAYVFTSLSIATAAVVACSSSSNNGSPEGGTGTGSGCAALTTGNCCASQTGTNLTTCQEYASSEAVTSAECAQAVSLFCKGSSTSGPGSSGSGTSVGGTSGTGTSGSGPSSGTGTGGTGTGAGGDGGGGGDGGTGCTPHTPSGTFTAKPPAAKTSCTSSTLQTLDTDCFTDAATQTTCSTALMSTCGECAITDLTAANWGAIVLATPVGGDMDPLQLTNVGGCLQANSTSSDATNCGNAFEELLQCEMSACLSYCPIPQPDGTSTGGAAYVAATNALFGTFSMSGSPTNPGCTENADSTVCATQANALTTACASFTSDAGMATGLLATCENFINSTTITVDQFFGAYCGGADAGL